MAGQFSYLNFLRHIPAEVLAKYFASKGIDLDINFKELNKKGENIVFQAIMALSDDEQTLIETEFQNVNAMACEGGITALIDEANFHQDFSFIEAISAIDGFHAKAMLAFLEKNNYWRAATMFLHADNVCASYWKKRNDLPKVAPYVGKIHIAEFEKGISDFFHRKEGRGRNCKVEVYRRYDKEYFFAYPEDFGQSEVEWVSDKLKTRAYHPAFEIIFVYCQDEGSLDIYAPKNNKAVPELQKIFMQIILKHNGLEDDAIDQLVYHLEPLSDRNFEFKIEPDAGISNVIINRLRVTLRHGIKRRVIIEADTIKDPTAIHELLEMMDPPAYYVTQASIKVTFESKEGKRAQTRTFSISYPNYCSLNHDGRDRIIRDMLVKSGIEPRENSDA